MDKKIIDKLIRIYENIVRVLVFIAESPETDSQVLKKLSKLTDSWIETCVFLHPNTPSYILEKGLECYSGSDGTDEGQRVHIVYNPSLRMEVLKKIIKNDSSEYVRDSAQIALIDRRASDPKATPKELLDWYKKVDRIIPYEQRKMPLLATLVAHPKFPIKALKRLKNKKRENSFY